MGCDCCPKSNYGTESCTASRSYRANTCDVTFPGEKRKGGHSNYTKPKKRKKR